MLTAPSVGARIHRHSTAIASGEQIHGSTYNVRKNPLPGSSRASIDAATSPSTDCAGTTITMNSAVTTNDVANDESVSTERQLSSPTYRIGPSRSQRCTLSQATTSIGSSRKTTTPNRLGASSAYPSAVDRTRATPTESLKRAQRRRTTVLAVTAIRQVDTDFLELPRHQLADAALSAAVSAGASHADLRIHRIVNEVVALRDGELETSVVDREVGFAVRVIVDGTWGFASHAELDADVAAETARRAVQVARVLAPLNAETIELAPEPVYCRRQLGVRLPDRPVRDSGGRQDRSARGVFGAAAGRRRRRPRLGQRACGQGADVLCRHARLVDHPAAGAGAADAGGGDRRRRGGNVRNHAHAGAADRAGLGGRRRRRRVGLVGRSWPSCRRCSPRRSRRPA